MTDDDPNRSEKTFFGAQLILLQYRFFSEHSNEDSSGSVKVVIVTGRSLSEVIMKSASQFFMKTKNNLISAPQKLQHRNSNSD